MTQVVTEIATSLALVVFFPKEPFNPVVIERNEKSYFDICVW